jgi:hypothetical protein
VQADGQTDRQTDTSREERMKRKGSKLLSLVFDAAYRVSLGNKEMQR